MLSACPANFLTPSLTCLNALATTRTVGEAGQSGAPPLAPTRKTRLEV